MPEFPSQTIAEWTAGEWSSTPASGSIRGFCHDTRQLQPGDCFVALKTAQRDGHDFLGQAKRAGAAAAIVSEVRSDVSLPQLRTVDPLLAFQTIALQHRHTFPGKVVGITGSCGKTSTKDLTAHLLGERCLKTQKNLNNTLGVPLTITQLDPVAHDFGVIEAGINQPGEMSALGGMIAPDIAVVTMIGDAHLEKLGSIENIAREKAELVRLAAPGSTLVCGANCLQFDAFRHFAGEIFAVCLACEKTPALDYTEYRSCCRYYRDDDGSTRVQVYSPVVAGQFVIRASVTAGMVTNAVIAAITAVLCGAKWSTIQERMNDWKPAADRGATYRHEDNYYYVDCYNANPASMIDALKTFQTIAPPELPKTFVLGGMKELGDASDSLHEKVGAHLILDRDDRAVLVGEEAKAYEEGLRKGGAIAEQITWVEDASEALATVQDRSGAVFVKGSRAYALEQVLPHGLLGAKEVATC
ncbi:MAG: UDP-N-acetylmuramoyl-tripeptide--D-alanyl-D-alanine ligase [Verrucomicrobiota bacterium]